MPESEPGAPHAVKGPREIISEDSLGAKVLGEAGRPAAGRRHAAWTATGLAG